MVDLNRPSLQNAFQTVQRRMVALLEYATAVTPAVKDDIRLLPELADSVVVLAVSRLDSFFIDVVSLGTRHREQMLRKHFVKHGQKRAQSCDLPALVKMVRRRVSFEDGGRRIDNLFQLMFRCPVWPTDTVRDLVLDLVLLRNLRAWPLPAESCRRITAIVPTPSGDGFIAGGLDGELDDWAWVGEWKRKRSARIHAGEKRRLSQSRVGNVHTQQCRSYLLSIRCQPLGHRGRQW